MTKARKGTPTVFEQAGWLRIRFTHNSKLYKFSLGIPSSKATWRQAEGIAQRILNDINAEVFDKSLKRYKPYSKEPEYIHDRLTAVALFKEFVEHKAKQVATTL